MYRISITPSGNYAKKINSDDPGEIEDTMDLLTDGNPIVLVDELPDDINDLFMSKVTTIEDVT